MSLVSIICAAIVIEGIVTYVKAFFVDGKFQWQMLVGIILGVVVATAYGLDAFSIVGMSTSVPFVGCTLTGVLLSRGANYIYDLIDSLEQVTNPKK